MRGGVSSANGDGGDSPFPISRILAFSESVPDLPRGWADNYREIENSGVSGNMPQAALRNGVAGMVQAQAVAPDHAKGGLLPFPLLPLEMELGQHVGLGDTLDGELELAVGPFRTGCCVEGGQCYRKAQFPLAGHAHHR